MLGPAKAQVRKRDAAAAAVAQAEQVVTAVTAELAKLPEIKAAPVRSIGSFPKRISGWVPTTDKLPKAS